MERGWFLPNCVHLTLNLRVYVSWKFFVLSLVSFVVFFIILCVISLTIFLGKQICHTAGFGFFSFTFSLLMETSFVDYVQRNLLFCLEALALKGALIITAAVSNFPIESTENWV